MNIAIVRPQGFPGVDDYFEQQPFESMGPILGRGGGFTVKDYITDKFLSLQGVAQHIVSSCDAGDSALVVCHGADKQLSIPIGAGSKQPVTTANINKMNQAMLDGKLSSFIAVMAELGVSNKIEAEFFYKNILFIRTQIRLKHLAFRACRAGNDKALLEQICLLFYCDGASAPKLRDFFGRGRPSFYSPADFDKLKAKHPNNYYFGDTANRLGLYATVNGSKGKLQFVCDSKDAIPLFMRAKFGFNNPAQYKRGDWMVMHGLWNEGKFPFFFFPTEPGYNGNIETFHFDEMLPPIVIPDEVKRTGFGGLIDKLRARRRGR